MESKVSHNKILETSLFLQKTNTYVYLTVSNYILNKYIDCILILCWKKSMFGYVDKLEGKFRLKKCIDSSSSIARTVKYTILIDDMESW